MSIQSVSGCLRVFAALSLRGDKTSAFISDALWLFV